MQSSSPLKERKQTWCKGSLVPRLPLFLARTSKRLGEPGNEASAKVGHLEAAANSPPILNTHCIIYRVNAYIKKWMGQGAGGPRQPINFCGNGFPASSTN